MEDIVNRINLIESELIELKVNKDYFENKITVAENINYELKCKVSELDREIVAKQNELNNRLNGLQLNKEINCYSQLIQDVTKRWMNYLDETLGDYSSYLDYLVPVGDNLVQLAKQFVEVKNQILAKELKPGWTRDSIKRYTDDLMIRVADDVQHDLRFEREELAILKKRIESDTELLKYSVTDTQLEPPSFNHIPIKQIEIINFNDFERKAKRHSSKLIGDYKKWSKKCDKANMDLQAGPSNGGGHNDVSYRHQQQQYPSQTKTQSQEIIPINTSDIFGSGNNGKIDEHPTKGSNHRVNVGESQERTEEQPAAQPSRNHVKFEEVPRSNQYQGERSVNDLFEQSEIETRKRKHKNEIPSSSDKVVDVPDDSCPDYADEDGSDAKKGKYDSNMDSQFGNSYFEQEFLKYPSSTQADDHLFSFTQDQDFLDLNNDFFGEKTESNEDASIKGAFC